MIKKIIIAGALCFVTAQIQAQVNLKINLPQKESTSVSPIVKEKIETYANEINSIIQAEKAKMEVEINAVNATLQAGSISESEANTQKAAIADRYSAAIDDKISALGFDLDDVVSKQVRYSLLNEDANSEKELKEKLIKRYKPARSVTSYISYGAMMLDESNVEALDQHKGFANNLEIGFKLNYQFSQTSPWALTSGLGFSWRTIRMEDNYYFTKVNTGETVLAQDAKNLDKSKLRTGYIMIPLGLQYNFSKIKTVADDISYRPYYKGWKLGANMYGGVRMGTNNIVKGDQMNFRNKEDYHVNPFVYGAQLTLGYDSWSLFVKRDFSDYFKNNNFNNTKMVQVGLTYDF